MNLTLESFTNHSFTKKSKGNKFGNSLDIDDESIDKKNRKTLKLFK